MEFELKTRQEIISKESIKYRNQRKKDKGEILNRVVEIIGYNRKYAAWLIRQFGKKLKMKTKCKSVIFIAQSKKSIRHRRKRRCIYDEKVLQELKRIWAIMDFACGKRLVSIMRIIIEKLEQVEEIALEEETRKKLLNISAATIDRLLRREKRYLQLKRRGSTKPGSLLKSQIKIRTFSEWDEKKPGYIEIDLVAHEGGNARGDYNYTLNCTDIATGWTEAIAVQNRAQIWTLNALKIVKERLPFDLLGIDSDNGSEFINNHLIEYCKLNKIEFTRSRPNKKNDNCFVEQKNWTVVRRTVGYNRYEGTDSLKVLNKLYEYHRLYYNFFQPNMKLISKERQGSKIKKKYDYAKTPYQRLLESPFIPESKKKKLRKTYNRLNPVELLKSIEKTKNALVKLAIRNNNDILKRKIN